MPIAFTRAPAEIEKKEPGIGGKPPVDRRPTGGGGGGGDDDWQNPRKGPRERLQRIRFFVFFGLAGDMMFFAALVVLFFARQAGMHMDPHSHEMIGDWHPIQLPPIVYLNTAFLILSSLAMEFGRRNIFREIDVLEEWLGLGRPALRRTLPWVGAALVFGTLFLLGQFAAWRQHAAHLVLGVIALVICLTALNMFKRVELRQIAVDVTSWYWHTLGVAWLLLL